MLSISYAMCNAASTLNIRASRAGSGILLTIIKGYMLLKV